MATIMAVTARTNGHFERSWLGAEDSWFSV
jgi:hypothetical protein